MLKLIYNKYMSMHMNIYMYAYYIYILQIIAFYINPFVPIVAFVQRMT